MRKRLDLIILIGMLALSFGIWSWGITNDQAAKNQLVKTRQSLSLELASDQERLSSYLVGVKGLYESSSELDSQALAKYVEVAVDQDKYRDILFFSYANVERNSEGGIESVPVIVRVDSKGEEASVASEDLMNQVGFGVQVRDFLANNQTSLISTKKLSEVGDYQLAGSLMSLPVWSNDQLVGVVSMALSQEVMAKNLDAWIDPKIGWRFSIDGVGTVATREIQSRGKMLSDEIVVSMPGGEVWKIELYESNLPSSVWNAFLGISLLISFMFYAIVYGLTSAGVRAEALAEQMTIDLQKYKLALDSTFSHVVITDPDGVVIYANKSVELTTGYPNVEVLGKTPRLWGGLMSQDFYQKMWHQIKKERKPFHGEITNKKKDGTVYIAKASISPIIDKLGGLVGFVGVEEDITEQKNHQVEIERQVLTRTSELRAVIDTINRGLVVVSPECKIILQNRVIREILEINREVEIEEFTEFVGHLVDCEKVIDQVLTSKADYLAEPKLFGARYLQLHAVPVLEDDQAVSVAVFIKDVTESLALERSRDEFFSIASHELRTPLTAIRGNAEMIKEQYGAKITQPQVLEMLDDIHTGSIRLIEIVNDFLNLSRLEMGKIDYKLVSLDLAPVIAQLIKEFELTAADKLAKIELESDGQVEYLVKADIDRVKQVLFNLIGNAVKFSQNKPIKVKLTNDSQLITIYVSDQGEGIPLDRQGLLFHKFQQAGDSLYTRDTSRGTGLGLYISRLMVEGMGGKIWLVKSEVSKGSVFAFSLPIAKKSKS